MDIPFKMTPKQEGFIKSMRKAGKNEAANKIEAGIKAKDKDSVDGAMLMDKDYAAMMGGYKSEPIKMDKGMSAPPSEKFKKAIKRAGKQGKPKYVK